MPTGRCCLAFWRGGGFAPALSMVPTLCSADDNSQQSTPLHADLSKITSLYCDFLIQD